MNNDRHMGLMIHIWMAEEKKEETYQQNEFTPFGWKFMYQDKPPKGNPVVTMIDTKMRNSGVITNPEIHKRLRHRGHLQSGELKDTKDNFKTPIPSIPPSPEPPVTSTFSNPFSLNIS